MEFLKELTIGEVARQTGFSTSALRYYESVGLISPAGRINKQRRYHPDVLNRLAIIETAQQAGFSIPAISQLLAGFVSNPVHPGGNWESLARQKIVELDRQIIKMRQMQELLTQLLMCECLDLNQCGRTLLKGQVSDLNSSSLAG
jgi:MerR family redox-sensitive transcriptional activator SoxR